MDTSGIVDMSVPSIYPNEGNVYTFRCVSSINGEPIDVIVGLTIYIYTCTMLDGTSFDYYNLEDFITKYKV